MYCIIIISCPDGDVFLGVPFGMNSRDVFIFFTKFGPVNFAKVYQGKQGNFQFAFVTFQTRETRQTVLAAGEAE